MTDSDTDVDVLQNNVYNFRDHSTTVFAKGPHINNNASTLGFQNNMLTSTMNMPWNLERSRYAESVYDQRSVYYRRETSPMSFRSMSGLQPRNFNNSYYPGGISSHRSVFNKRSGSPMSVRTLDSNASLSAADIALAFKNEKFNNYELRLIKEAFNKYMKHRIRKRVEKRRNLRLFLKGGRRQSGGESGEQGSNSSISSDDCQSIRSSRPFCKEKSSSGCRSTRTDLTEFKRTMQQSNMYRDRTDIFRQNSLRNMFSVPPSSRSLKETAPYRSSTVITQKERFKNSFLLPSQRFNQSVASLPIPEQPTLQQGNSKVNRLDPRQRKLLKKPEKNIENNSDQEEIFSEVTVAEKSVNEGIKLLSKRSLDDNEICGSDKKRSKLSSPQKRKKISKQEQPKSPNDFVFAKPQFPIKKAGTIKSREENAPNSIQAKNILEQHKAMHVAENMLHPTEQLISKSTQPFDPEEMSEPVHNLLQNNQQGTDQNNQAELSQYSTTDMSMRPSFIKRKLFTQKIDADKNSSSDHIEEDSSQSNIYSIIQREKNRTRKLVASQSCLSRDVLGDDSNLLDLIHKIVPRDQMNITTVTNKSEGGCNKDKPVKWDVSAVIATCNNYGDGSDTYTDEEIFKVEDIKIKSHVNEKVQNDGEHNLPQHKNPLKCTVSLQKLQILNKPKIMNEILNKSNSPIEDKGCHRSKMVHCVKSFWDTDIESDMDLSYSPYKNSRSKKTNQTGTTSYKETLKEVQKEHSAVPPKVEKENQLKKLNMKVTLNKTTANTERVINTRTPKVIDKSKNITSTVQSKHILNNISNIQPKPGQAKVFTKTNPLQSKRLIVESRHSQIKTSNTIAKPSHNTSSVIKSKRQNESSNKLNTEQNKTTAIKPKQNEIKQNNTYIELKPKENKSSEVRSKSRQKKPSAVVPTPRKNEKSTIAPNNKPMQYKKPKANEISKPPNQCDKLVKNATFNKNSKKEGGDGLKKKNYSLRTHSTRTPNVKKCCNEPSINNSVNESCETLYRSLRSREIDLSSSLNSNTDSPWHNRTSLKNKSVSAKNKIICNLNKSQAVQSDISFTLTPFTPNLRQLRHRQRKK